MDAQYDMGPLISEKQMRPVSDMIKIGIEEGATLVIAGKPVEGGGGYFLSPTVFADTKHSMRVVSEEIFGRVLVTMSFRSTNDTEFGLAAGIWTKDIGKAHKTAAQIKAGLLWINCHGIPDRAVPFEGYKQSGWGRENGYEALLQYTELKSVIAKLQEPVGRNRL